MSLQDKNKLVVARYHNEFWSKGNVGIVDELCHDDIFSNYPMHGPRRGKEALKAMYLEFKEAFPNASFHSYGPFPLIADGDYVVLRWIGGGKHTGPAFFDPVMGGLETPNTGKELHFSGTTIFEIKNGKILEEIGEEGSLTALQQLGLISAPAPRSANT